MVKDSRECFHGAIGQIVRPMKGGSWPLIVVRVWRLVSDGTRLSRLYLSSKGKGGSGILCGGRITW